MKKLFVTLTVMLATCGFMSAPAWAVMVSQLNIEGGAVLLNVGRVQLGPANFSTQGTLVMGQFQPPPNIIDPVNLPLGHQMELVTDGMQGQFPPPSGEVNGNTINVDLNSLFAKFSGPLIQNATGGNTAFLHIGNNATGRFDPSTGAFEISWLKIFKEKDPWLLGAEFTLNGTGETAPPVPIPGTLLLFGTGLLGLPFLRKGVTRKG